MNYCSTRSLHTTNSLNAVLEGMAPDGGLYTPLDFSSIDIKPDAVLNMTYRDMAKLIMGAFLPDFNSEYSSIESIVEKAYTNKFETPDITPLVKAGDTYLLELFRGPTSAFKDVALSVLPLLISAAMKHTQAITGREQKTVILTATSGDTGKAALEGFKDVEGIRIIVFYPDGGVSPVQKLQMTTQEGSNVLVCAVRGNFDDCQRGVKTAFGQLTESALARGIRLSSANSINIGRLVPQTVYYYKAYADLVKLGRIKLGDPVDFCVPTGNFGDILAGWFAKQAGLPVGKLICASNRNNVLTDFLRTGVYDRRREFFRTSSPSMDILVSSNLERLLFYSCGGDAEKVSFYMARLAESGIYQVDRKELEFMQDSFCAYFCTEEESARAIGYCYRDTGYLMDPHTSAAWSAAEKYSKEYGTGSPVVALSTASPYKFPAAVLRAIQAAGISGKAGPGDFSSADEFEQMEILHGITGVPIPANLENLKSKKQRFADVTDAQTVCDYVKKQILGE